LGDFQKSSELRERATQCAKGVIDEAWLNLGYVRAAQERYSDARDCFLRAIKICARYKEARAGLREAQLILAGVPNISQRALRAKINRINNSKDSVPNYMILLTREFLKKADSIDEFILYLHCRALGQVARYDEATALLPKVHQWLKEAEHFVWSEFAIIHAMRMNFNEAERYFRKALARKPGDVVSCREFGVLRRKQGRFAAAEKLLRLAVRQDSENDYNWEELGNLYRGTERFAEAERCYKKALALNPNLKDVRVALADVQGAQRWLKSHGKKAK
jgi:tetratricopeptide (TPR) repeat protein